MLLRKLQFLFGLIFSLHISYGLSQEICDNGIDDDNDGLIDLNDAVDCACSSSSIVEDGFLFNPSFEDKTRGCCPDGTNLDCVTSWVDGVEFQTPDYYHKCGSFGGAAKPIPDGDGYVGFFNQKSSTPNKMYKEYVGQCLQKPLKAGKATTLELYLSGGDWQSQPHPITIAIFGTTDCNNFPQNKPNPDTTYNFGCPTNGPNYIELGSVAATPNNTSWVNLSVNFTPTQDIAAVIIGADCSDAFPFDISMPAAVRYYMDDLKLTQTTPASSETAQITLTGNTCENNRQLNAQTSIVGGSYQWYKDGVAIVGATALTYNVLNGTSEGGNYQVYATGSGTCALSNAVAITNAGAIEPGFRTTRLGDCDDFRLQFTDTSNVVNGFISEWEWDFGDNSPSTFMGSSHGHDYRSAGSYLVKLIITTDQNCKDSIEKIVQISNEKPTANFSVISACEGVSIDFTDASTSNVGIAIYDWDFGGLGSSNLPNPSFIFNTHGNQNVTLTVTDNAGCTHDTTEQIMVHERPIAAFSVNDTCTGSLVNFENLSTIGSGSIQSSLWDFGDNSAESTIYSPNHKYALPGLYDISLTVTSDNGCNATISESSIQFEIPQPTFVSSQIAGCAPICIDFFNNSSITSGAITTLQWDFGNDSTSNDLNPTMCFENGNYDISLIAISDMGCVDTTVNPEIVSTAPEINADFFTSTDSPNIELGKVNFVDGSSGDPIEWYWTFYSMDTASILGTSNQASNHFIFPTDTGSYQVKLFIRNQEGCIDSVIKLVVLYPDFKLYMPNTFTPNGDGVNDNFFPVGIGFSPSEDFSFIIFNRWGDIIFESNNLGDSWDGIAHKKGGKELVQQGIYVWKLVVRDMT